MWKLSLHFVRADRKDERESIVDCCDAEPARKGVSRFDLATFAARLKSVSELSAVRKSCTCDSREHEQPYSATQASKGRSLTNAERMNAGGKRNALDNFCNPPGPVAARSREQLYARRIHSHFARDCTGRASDPVDLRAKACHLRTPTE